MQGFNEMIRDFWRSLQGSPRGHNKVLAVAAWARLVAVLAVSLRLMYDAVPVPELPQSVMVTRFFVVASVTYAIALLFALRFARGWFFTIGSKVAQVLVDIAIFWIAQFLVHSTKSDIYYLNLIPMVIAVEFFPFIWAFNIFALIIAGHLALLDLIQPRQTLQIWVRDFLPRGYIFLVINAIFFTQRQMRTEPERNLENDREEIIASVRQQLDKVPGVDRNYINRLERRLDKFIDKTELYRRMYPRRIDDGGEELDYSRILGAFDDSTDGGLREQADNPMQVAREAIEELAKSLHCAAAIFRVETTVHNGGSRLDVEFAWGCGAKQINERHTSIAEGKDSLAWRAFRSNHIQTWTQSKSNSPAKQFANLDFIGECGIQSALSAPMALLGRRGLVSFYRAEPIRFTSAEKAEIQATLDLIQVAVEKSYESARLREWLEALRLTAGELTKPVNEQEILDYVVKQVQAVFRAESVAVFLLRGEHLKRKAEVGIPHDWFADEAYQQDRGLTWQAFASSESFVLTNNASTNGSILREHLTKYKEQLPSHEVRHLLAVPIRTQTKMLGVLRLVNKVEAPGKLAAKGFTRSEGQVLVSLCSTVALALHSTQRLRQFTVLQSLVQKTSGLQSEEEAVNAVCAVACEAVNGDQSGIVMFYEDGSVGRVVGQVVKSAAGESSLEAKNPTTFPPITLSNYRAVTEIVESQKAIAILEAQSDKRTIPAQKHFRKFGIQSILLAPLVVGNTVIGTLGVDSVRDRRQFLQEELDLCELIAAYGARAIEQAARFSQAKSRGQLVERERLRADVHDIRALLGSTVIVKLQLMQDALHDGRLSAVDQMLAGTLTIAKSINDSILHVMDDLQDATLSEEGLQAAIENYVQRYWAECDITITSNLKERLAPNIEGQLYRIAQEAIANACEHGLAGRPDGCVQVVLMYDPHEHTVVLRIADNGCGFDVQAERLPTIGLLMMKERAKRLRTELIVHSTSAGTIVTVIVSTIIDLEDEGV